MNADRDIEITRIANLLREAQARAAAIEAATLSYLIGCAIDEAREIAAGQVALPRKR